MPFTNTSVVEIAVKGLSATGQDITNVFHYRNRLAEPGTFTNQALRLMVEQFQLDWREKICPLLSNDYKVILFRGRAITGVVVNPTPPPANMLTIGEQFDLPGDVLDVGAKAGIVAATFTAFGVQKLTDRAGKNFRGSFRLGTITETDFGGNTVFGAAKTALDTNTLLFVQDFLPSTPPPEVFWEMCVLSRTLLMAAPPPYTDVRALTADVTGTRVNPFVTSQTSRKQSLTRPT